MVIFLAADHRGFELKEVLEAYLCERGYDVVDVGDRRLDEDDDYVDFACKAAEKVAANPQEHRGIFLCGSGHGVDMVANKYRGVRATLGFNDEVVQQSREHDDSNVLVLAADWVDEGQAKRRVDIWLSTEFSEEERHKRRLEKISEIEKKNFRSITE